MKREVLNKRLSSYRFVSGHGPKFENMTDDQLEQWLNSMDKAIKDAFSEEQDDDVNQEE